MNPTVVPSSSLMRFSFRYRFGARAWILFLALLAAVAGVASPVFQKVFIDRVLGAESVEASKLGLNFLHDVSPMMAIVIAFFCTLIAQALGLIGNFLSVKEGSELQRVFSEALYRKTLSIRSDSLGATTIGEVVSLYATDVAGSTALIDQVLPMAAFIVFNMVTAPLAIYWICGIPMWATLTVMTTIVSLTIVLATRQSRFFARFKQLAAERTGIVNEWVQTIRLLRILGWVENFENKIFRKRIEETDNRVAMVTNGQLMNSFGSSINFVINITGVASLIYLSGKKITAGELFAMLWIFGVFLARSFRQIPWFFTFTLDSMTSMKRLEVFLSRPSDAGSVEEVELPDLRQARPMGLEVRDLNLTIRGQPILRDISFWLREGEFAAIVGEVGSGKTMLALSLVGETGATFGSFQIGASDALELSLNERRLRFGYVPQEGFVMSASLRENIVFKYDAGTAYDASVAKSLRVAQFPLEEIQGAGLGTEIGERGVNLSGGQRQRVSLARAHHFERPVVLLDDCLSAVDVDTERLLLRDLIEGEWKNHTRLLVTHRLSVLSRVDKILFLENGRIVETGTFNELMKRSPKMQEFVSSVTRSEQEVEKTGLDASHQAAFASGLNAGLNAGLDGASSEGGADVKTEHLP